MAVLDLSDMEAAAATPLYHRDQALFRRGDRIPPGTWGRTVLGFGGRHDFFFREYLFETIRKAEFPDLPSRLTSAFAFEDAGFAQQFRGNQARETRLHGLRGRSGQQDFPH